MFLWQTQTHSHFSWPFTSMTNSSADIPHPGSAWALFGLAEREQKPFGPCSCTAHVSLTLVCTHTATHPHTLVWHVVKSVHIHLHVWSNPKPREHTAVSTQTLSLTHTQSHTTVASHLALYRHGGDPLPFMGAGCLTSCPEALCSSQLNGFTAGEEAGWKDGRRGDRLKKGKCR